MFTSWKGKYEKKLSTGLSNRTNLRTIWNSHFRVLDFSRMPRSSGEVSHCTFPQCPLISLNCPFALWVGEARWLCILNSPEHGTLAEGMDIGREQEQTQLRTYSYSTLHKLHTILFNSQKHLKR